MKVTIIIPSYNPTKKLIKLVSELQKNFNDILIVDDGSTNETKKIYEELLNVKIIYHDIFRIAAVFIIKINMIFFCQITGYEIQYCLF